MTEHQIQQTEQREQCGALAAIPVQAHEGIRLVLDPGVLVIPEVVRCAMEARHYGSRMEGHLAPLGESRPLPARRSFAGPAVEHRPGGGVWYGWPITGDPDPHRPGPGPGPYAFYRCPRDEACALPERHRGNCMPEPLPRAVRDLGPLSPRALPGSAAPDTCPAPAHLLALTPAERFILWARAHFPLGTLAHGVLIPLGELEIRHHLEAARRKLWDAPGLPAAVAVALATEALPRPPARRQGPLTLSAARTRTLTAILLGHGDTITPAARGNLRDALDVPKGAAADDCRLVWTAYASGALSRAPVLDLLYPDGRTPQARPQ
ncbi:hypothetical protein [Streptomyces sp. NPDC088925]|uniref:hypothetical protein n=1 Tax=Streptomyces sp. NPDC088925 TaxID=3365914 RepID=UPI003801C4A7